MKTNTKYLFTLLCAVCTLFLSGCHNATESTVRRVLVIHSYSDEGDEGKPFRDAMAEEFQKHGILVQAHHVYLDYPYRLAKDLNENIFPHILDSVFHSWKPEIILLNDDPAYHFALAHNQDSLFTKFPVVFSGVSMLSTDSLMKFPNFTGFEDQIDLAKNIDFLTQFTESRNVIIQLDKTEKHDAGLMRMINTVLEDTTLYINNMDFHEDFLNYHRTDKTCVTFMSLLDTGLDSPDPSNRQLGKDNNNRLLKNAENYHFLNIKNDWASSIYVVKSGLPQFTAVREGFNNPHYPLYLGGYFTSMENQVADQVAYANMILEGKSPEELSISSHKKAFYLDYRTLDLLPNGWETNFRKYKDTFHMVNVPDSTNHPDTIQVLKVASTLLVLLLAAGVALFEVRRHTRIFRRKRKQLESEIKLRSEVLESSKSTVWRITRGAFEIPAEIAIKRKLPKRLPLDRLYQMVAPAQVKSLEKFFAYDHSPINANYKKLRISLTFDNGKSWHWYDFISNSSRTILGKTMSGLAICVDEEAKHEQMMEKALAQAKEVEVKEHFLENISVSLQAPLQQIRYHADMMSDPKAHLTKEQMNFLNEKISQGAATLLKSIDSVVQASKKVFTVVLLLSTAYLFSSCGQEKKPLKVMLIHQYSRELTGYQEFHKSIATTFEEAGYKPEFRHIYLDLKDQTVDQYYKQEAFQNSVYANGWMADVILAEGDRAAWYLQEPANREIPKYRNDIPMIYGGIANPDWNILGKYANITVITDPLDVVKNVNLTYELTHKNCVLIEMDFFRHDLPIREEIKRDLRISPYIDNSDFHLPLVTDSLLSGALKDSIVVMTLSAYSTEMNHSASYIPKEIVKNMKELSISAFNNPQLVLKYDLYGDALCFINDAPQFTSRREFLGNGERRFLAGYFADYCTVGEDMANAAIQRLKGLRNMEATRTHAKHYYMDYEAMERMGMKYRDYADDYVIKNAPYEVVHPIKLWAKRIGMGMLAILSVWGVAALYMLYCYRKHKNFMAILENEKELSRMAIQGARNHYIANRQEMENLLELVKPELNEQRNEIVRALDKPGNYTFRIRANVEEGGQDDWWILRFAVAKQENGEHMLEGLIININDSMEHEKQLRQAEALELEAREKEKFLWKIAHEIRTPLNSIMGFSEVLTTIGNDMDEEEKQDLYTAIQNSSDALQKIITDIIQYSHLVSHKETFELEEVNVGNFLRELFQKEMKPRSARYPEIEYVLITGREGIVIQADRKKLTNAVMQLINNAEKFSEKGHIVLGWIYHLNNRQVEIFVEDHGQGIPKEKLSSVFSMFWKNNSFIPGLGIGLNIVQRFTEGMRGAVTVESEVGEGSRFMLNFPVIRP